MRRYSLIFLCMTTIYAADVDEPMKDIGNVEPRIVNGEEAQEGQLPWQVGILGRTVDGSAFFCGGALISEEWVLTAGHCVDGIKTAAIYSGATKLSSPNRTTSQGAIFVLHEDYDHRTLQNDIGLIQLRAPLTFDDKTSAIALASDELETGVNVTVSGWGQTSDSDTSTSDALNYITVSTISNSDCAIYYGSVVGPGTVCTSAGNPLKSPCLGDSGGPVVTNITEPLLVAVFSFVNGYGCELPYPAGNTRTAYYRDWIRNKTEI
ncbi:Trypsin domain containing protein [Asbolus verrucosus]|uniref:Trypsin domain containing protein n=1 Tax=Asbolus verrucosus TaxID=1661398 RepID=A0A482VX92_ASBVE|nr:Trypsin domain containing protein [Asbolus verrucosus]